MKAYLLVFLGAGIGGVLRHGASVLAARWLGTGFPYGTLAVNVIGGLAIGILAEWFALRAAPGQGWRLLLITGVLGGFTTFSAFSLQVALMIERGTHGLAALYVAVSVAAAVGGLFLGMAAVRQLA